jgi:phosphoenolpyruvate carboxykinase (ATP)
MGFQQDLQGHFGLDDAAVRYQANLTKDELFDAAIAGDRGRVTPDGPDDQPKARPTKLGKQGPLVFTTDPSCTGRPVQDTFGVAGPGVEDEVWWKPDFQRFDPEKFGRLLKRVGEHLNERGATLYVQDVFAGSDPEYAVPYRFVGEYATHAMFVHNMFPKGVEGVADAEAKRWTLLNVPSFHADPERDGTRSARAVIMDFERQLCLVIGRADYCGVNKKTMFTVMNYLLPKQGHMSMHCSANIGSRGDAAILFGLSGTGKTTLSADPARQLIGDDETAWTQSGISNLEDGCYAKLIDLDKQAEPIIAAALSMPGTLIENVPCLPGKPMEETDPQELDLSDSSITENTRFSYPLSCNPNVAEGQRGGHPETIVLLTADAFGVLPPVSVLDAKEVMYHFVMGFTAKLAGTEVKAAFSPCYGAPFMAHQPSVYAKGLAEKMAKHEARCILLNTGWGGGAYGVGKRISIKDTRALLDAALAGELHADDMEYNVHPIFDVKVPKRCTGVDPAILDPRSQWQDKDAYDKAAGELRALFQRTFEQKGFAELGIEPVM